MIQQDIKAASAANTSCLFIGQDRGGHWVVKDAHSLCGGLFANRNEAIGLRCMNANADRNRSLCCPTGSSSTGRSMKARRTIPASGARRSQRR